MARRRITQSLAVFLLALTWPSAMPAHASLIPSSRFGNAMARDPATGKVVMFGGGTFTTNSGETWTWNGTGWARPTPFPSPESRKNAVMAEDPTTGTIVLFGGDGGKEDTWTWNGTTKSWTDVTPILSPMNSGFERPGAMAYDGATGKVVLFTTSPDLGVPQTWTWDGDARTWTLENPLTSPPRRRWSSMAYDPVSQRVVLFGGDNTHGGGELLNDTWTWDGRAETWTKESPATSPEPRGKAYMTYHTATSKIVLFGGGKGFGRIFDDTWTWDGRIRNWIKQKPVNRPCPRMYGAMAYHAATSSAVIFGSWGRCPDGSDPGTWAWNGVNWKKRA